jgi:hypothetical protein
MHDLSRRQYGEWGVREALTAYSGLSVVPDNGYGLLIAGTLAFRAEPKGHEIIADSYEVEIRVPGDFPHGAPIVKERGHRIPAGFHTYTDGTLCLGSPVRLQLTLSRDPTLLGFLHNCLVPYLYGYSYFERHGVLPFGELAHGKEGLWHDYAELFGVACRETILAMIQLASMQHRIANRQLCPCGSGARVGRCHNRMLNGLRRRLGRLWWRGEHERLVALRAARKNE